MARRLKNLSFLALLAFFIPIFGCSPRPLLRFVQSLVKPEASIPQGEAALARFSLSGKSRASKAITFRPLRLKCDPRATGDPPAWPRPNDSLMTSVAAPPSVLDPASKLTRGELDKPAYLKAYRLARSGSRHALPG